MDNITLTKQHRYVVYIICTVIIAFSLHNFLSEQPVPANLTFKYWVALAAGPIFLVILCNEIWRYFSAPNFITWDMKQQQLITEKMTLPFGQIDKCQLILRKGVLNISISHKEHSGSKWVASYKSEQDLQYSLAQIDKLPQFTCAGS